MHLIVRPDTVEHDTSEVVKFIRDTYNGRVPRVDYESARIRLAFEETAINFPHDGGVKGASPFKVAGYLACQLTSLKPVATPLPRVYNSVLRSMDNHQNGFLGFMAAKAVLEDAVIEWEDGTKAFTIPGAFFSTHSAIDFIDGLLDAHPREGYKLTAMALEQAVYKITSGIEYERLDENLRLEPTGTAQ